MHFAIVSRSCRIVVHRYNICRNCFTTKKKYLDGKLVKYTRDNRTVYVASPPVVLPHKVSSARIYVSKLFRIIPDYLRKYMEKEQSMSASKEGLLPPTIVRGMKTLDKNAFRRTVNIPSLVTPAKSIGYLTKYWKKSLLKFPGIKPLAELGELENKYKLLLLDPSKYGSLASFTDEDKEELSKMGVDLNTWKLFELELGYDNWNYSDILKAIVPESSDGVGGFSQIGHIVHLNLRDDLLDYKNIIGEVLLDKIKQAKTVVNKTNTIDNTYRNFGMEVLAGESNFVTISKEGGFAYEFDFSKVYWNPRLGTEHDRIVSLLQPGDVVYDMFAGVGPFAIPAAKKKCVVFANDLNPDSFHWLVHNIKLNKIKTEVSTHNLDGRAFVREVVRADLIKRLSCEDSDYHIHIVMNLPAMAIEFLDVFRGLLHGIDVPQKSSLLLPTVHCHCFSNAEDPGLDVKLRVEAVLGETLADGHHVRFVRNVAPKKDMMCATFTLTESILYGKVAGNDHACVEGDHTAEPLQKRRKAEDSDSLE